VDIALFETTSPFNWIASARGVLDSATLTAGFQFTEIPTGSYYLGFYHRNSIETWSSAPVSFVSGGISNYDFTTSSLKAYGSNMKQVDDSPIRFAIYNGDVNLDGIIDLNDVLLIYNDANNFITGYTNTDVTGNNLTDLTDLLIAYNNSAGFVGSIYP